MTKAVTRVSSIPCAIYTRKSSEDGLEQDFNSLDAQREACEAYIVSQRSLGWINSPVIYDDGGFSGGNTDRPALQQLLADVKAKRIKVIVVYKVDRLTRSLADFSKLVELFDEYSVSFVSVTQQFNTTTSMGRLTLNVLLSFAQFEREVTAERIRDKIAASKRRGIWMGGLAPIGYFPKDRALCIHEEDAIRIREIFKLYLDLGCVRQLKDELDTRGWKTPARTTKREGAMGNREFSRGHLYKILSNPVYIGQIVHKDEVFPGNQPALINPEIWHAVQERLATNLQSYRNRKNAMNPSLLAGLVFDANGCHFTPTHSKKGKRRYCYYVSNKLHQGAAEDLDGFRIPAQELEGTVLQGLKSFLTDDAKLLDWLSSIQGGNYSSTDIKLTLELAKEHALGLQSAPIETLNKLLNQVLIHEGKVEIGIKPSALTNTEGSSESFWISVPVELKRCGMAMRLIVNGPEDQVRKPDLKLLALIARGHIWFKRLRDGDADSLAMIAKEEEVTVNYVSRLLLMAMLAPDIIERISKGEHPPQLTAKKLISHLPLPADWSAQRKLLGVPER